LAAHTELSTLTTALKAAGLLNTALSGKGPLTVFAPSNDAFAKLDKATLDHLLDPENIHELQGLLEVHVTNGVSLHAADLKKVQNVKSLEGQDLSIVKDQLGVHVGFPYQLYWPELPAKVTGADNDASNAVVHIIDTVLMPPPSTATLALPRSSTQTLPQLLAAHPELSTLTKALKAAGLLGGTLSGNGPLTVFAPSNDAFAKLDKATLDHLLDPENISELKGLLEVHVANGVSLHSADLKKVQNVKSLEGRALSIVKDQFGVHVGFPYQLYWPELPAKVTGADNDATDAVVHIIDSLLISRPPSLVLV
jgi:uncharacterized surface protein with fasciclin (FAS1) repeats